MTKLEQKLNSLLNQLWKEDVTHAQLTEALWNVCGKPDVNNKTTRRQQQTRMSAIFLRRCLIDYFPRLKD